MATPTTDPDLPQSSPAVTPDPELAALPLPRRPWRRATLLALGLNGLASLALMVALGSNVAYSLAGGQPVEAGALADYHPPASAANSWIHGSGTLDTRAVTYQRPLDPDFFRLAPLVDNPHIWVELRQPADIAPEYFVPPSSFVGRLVPVSDPGLFHSAALQTIAEQPFHPSAGDWLVIDGESPADGRWVLGLAALLVAFASFSIFGLYRLSAPVAAR